MLFLPKELIKNLKIGETLLVDGEELMIVDKGFCAWTFQAKDGSFKSFIVWLADTKKYTKQYQEP